VEPQYTPKFVTGISSAVTESLNEMGRRAGLPNFIWRVFADQGIYIQGYPAHAEDANSCQLLADLLDMSLCSFDTGEVINEWSANWDGWTIELFSRSPEASPPRMSDVL
jgi:hypothetical protein